MLRCSSFVPIARLCYKQLSLQPASLTTSPSLSVRAQPISSISTLSKTSTSTVQAGRSKIVHDLSFLLSVDNAQSDNPVMQSPRDIKSFYRVVQAKNLSHQLTEEDFSALICLFGTLSASNTTPFGTSSEEKSGKDFETHPLASHIGKGQAQDRSHWGFVVLLAKEKVSHGYALNNSDNFWMMRAAFADAARFASGEAEGNVEQCLDRARTYYLNVRFHSEDWQIHHYYLGTLLQFGEQRAADLALRALCRLLEQTGYIHTRLRKFLWDTLTSTENLTLKTKSRFLHALRKKVGRLRDVLPQTSSVSLLSTITDSKKKQSEHDSQHNPYDATAIRDFFSDILFSRSPGTLKSVRYLRTIYPWALFESRAALCAFNDGTFASSEEEERSAWSSLSLLAITHLPQNSRKDRAELIPTTGLDGGIDSQSQVLGWTIICMLSAVSSEISYLKRTQKRDAEPMPSEEDIRDIARTLWILWRKEEAWRAGVVIRQPALVCSAASSFMTVAAMSDDTRLASSIMRLVNDAVIYPAQFGQEELDRNMLMPIAVQYGIMHLKSHRLEQPEQTWTDLFSSLQHAQLLPDAKGLERWRNTLASRLLAEYVSLDSEHAFNLAQSANNVGILIDARASQEICGSLVSSDHSPAAFELLRDGCLQTESANAAVAAILSAFVRRRPLYITETETRSLLHTFSNTSIRPTDGRILELVLEAALKSRLTALVHNIVCILWDGENSDGRPILSSRFLSNFASRLAQDRQYQRLGNIMVGIWRRSPSRLSSLCRNSKFHYTQRFLGASIGSGPKGKEIARTLPFSIYTWPVLRGRAPFSPRLPQLSKTILSLKISSSLSRPNHPLSADILERALYILVRAGRMSAAMKLASRFPDSRISPKAGNIILSGTLLPSPAKKGRRQVYRASKRLDKLVKEYGFEPDRVTFNILMKALLRWRSLTPLSTLRALFERLAVSGYAIPESFRNELSATSTHANIRRTQDSPIPVDLKSFPSHVSFRRHSLPLFKMFVKAFKIRGDRINARRVSEAIKEMKTFDQEERERREEARRIGRKRANERNRKFRI